MERSNGNNNILRDLGLKMGYNSFDLEISFWFPVTYKAGWA